MPQVTVDRENSGPVSVHYEDHGSGRPVLLAHGYPLHRQSWDKQVRALLDSERRVIAYDSRGWGRSSQPADGYDHDTLARDLHRLLDALDLRDCTLVGHSTGAGVVVRYLANHGSDRTPRAALISPVLPYLVRAADNPDGLPAATFDGYVAAAEADRLAWLAGLLDDVYDLAANGGTLVSDQAFQAAFNAAAAGSILAAARSISLWRADLRADVAAVDVPVLVVHGDQDRIAPIGLTGDRVAALLRDRVYVVVDGGPHAIPWTHADQVNRALLDFLV